ncbi:MAG: glycosyltransferase [Opitutales bacterium]|nr:glycosyltransferase [Opitutales bacterium]
MRIFWDTTKTGNARVQSGLNRVSRKLQEACSDLGTEIIPVVWESKKKTFVSASEKSILRLEKRDIFLTSELFSENERIGVDEWIEDCPAKTAAIFHDAIPLKYPEFTWPKSVARHPFYMKLLIRFDIVIANSESSANELKDYWNWLGIENQPPVSPIPLGADFQGEKRPAQEYECSTPLKILMVGIIEPRKNYDTALDAFELLDEQKILAELCIVGRTNPHFGKPIEKRIKAMIKRRLPLRYFPKASDELLRQLYSETHLTLFPSKAEGNGIPIMESLWFGKPAIANGIPPHLEHAKRGGGVKIIDQIDAAKLADCIESFSSNPSDLEELAKTAAKHPVPSWKQSAECLLAILKN